MTECWRWYLVDKKAPDSVKTGWKEDAIQFSGPVGLMEKDDMENWGYATEASNGIIARRYPYNYAQGLGRSGPHEAFPGASVSNSRSPTNATTMPSAAAMLVSSRFSTMN